MPSTGFRRLTDKAGLPKEGFALFGTMESWNIGMMGFAEQVFMQKSGFVDRHKIWEHSDFQAQFSSIPIFQHSM
jgi:hypothetical protein